MLCNIGSTLKLNSCWIVSLEIMRRIEETHMWFYIKNVPNTIDGTFEQFACFTMNERKT